MKYHSSASSNECLFPHPPQVLFIHFSSCLLSFPPWTIQLSSSLDILTEDSLLLPKCELPPLHQWPPKNCLKAAFLPNTIPRCTLGVSTLKTPFYRRPQQGRIHMLAWSRVRIRPALSLVHLLLQEERTQGSRVCRTTWLLAQSRPILAGWLPISLSLNILGNMEKVRAPAPQGCHEDNMSKDRMTPAT